MQKSIINGNNIKDKRHAIEMLIVKEDLRTRNIHVRWVVTFQMLGDVLTKRGVSVDLLLKVLNWSMFTIIEDKSIRPKNQQGVKENYFGSVWVLLSFAITLCCRGPGRWHVCRWGSEVLLRCRVSLVFALRWKERLLVLLGVPRLPPVGLTRFFLFFEFLGFDCFLFFLCFLVRCLSLC